MIRPPDAMIRSRTLSLCEFRAAVRAARPSGIRADALARRSGHFRSEVPYEQRSNHGSHRSIMAIKFEHAMAADAISFDRDTLVAS